MTSSLPETARALNNAYRERAYLVAFLASLFPAHIGRNDANEPFWWVVTIESPAGQMSWHVSNDDYDLFAHVRPTTRDDRPWDGHTTPQKYERLSRLILAGDRDT